MPLKLNGSTSGYVIVDAPAVAGTNTLTLPAVTDTVTTNAATQTLSNKTLSSPTITGTATSTGDISTTGTVVMGSSFLRNRIINGDMRIDQRNAGASVTPANLAYTLDRWSAGLSQSSKFSIQQNAGSVTPPTGFINYLGVTSSSAYSVLTSDFFTVFQKIEGLNISDLAWGTASAQTVTLSFWVRSSLTGTFGGALKNNASDRAYPFSYTINSANTWERETITIAGDTSGTWLTTSGVGINLVFSLGAGATYSTTAGAWAAGNYVSATGAQSVVGTNGATLYITGVQLEVGSVATPFERRLYGQELALCQRYYEKSYDVTTNPGTATTNGMASGYYNATNGINQRFPIKFAVTKRSTPTMLGWDAAGNANKVTCYNSGNTQTNNLSSGSRSFVLIGTQGAALNEADLGGYYAITTHWTAESEL